MAADLDQIHDIADHLGDVEDMLDRAEIEKRIELLVQVLGDRAIEIMDERRAFKGGGVDGCDVPRAKLVKQRLAIGADRDGIVIRSADILPHHIIFLFPEMDLMPSERDRVPKLEFVNPACEAQSPETCQIDAHD
ncbi:MAG: hypothetical protein J0G95_07330 [Rhizobiales bacterium]|nr:hypothetical protein [Hyphomicrobiales bacterium]